MMDGTHTEADADKQRCVKTPDELPRATAGATCALREYLANPDDAVPDPVGVTRWTPKAVSTPGSGHRLSRRLNVMIDSASDVVLDARASPARTAEGPITSYQMIDRVRARRGVPPRMLAAGRPAAARRGGAAAGPRRPGHEVGIGPPRAPWLRGSLGYQAPPPERRAGRHTVPPGTRHTSTTRSCSCAGDLTDSAGFTAQHEHVPKPMLEAFLAKTSPSD